MKATALMLLAVVSLSGCVGDYTTERIEARYQKGLSNCATESWCAQHMAEVREQEYSHRWSMRRLFGDYSGNAQSPVQVYRLN